MFNKRTNNGEYRTVNHRWVTNHHGGGMVVGQIVGNNNSNVTMALGTAVKSVVVMGSVRVRGISGRNSPNSPHQQQTAATARSLLAMARSKPMGQGGTNHHPNGGTTQATAGLGVV